MPSDRLERRIGQETVEGWRLLAIDDERAILKRPNYGSTLAHVIIFVLTVWFTAGLANVAYAAYRYLNDSQYKVVTATEPLTEEEALARLRRRYADGELNDDEFERRLERLLGTESVDDARTTVYEGRDREFSRG